MRILLTEDDRYLSDALQTILRHEKYTVDAVYNGQDGLEYAQTGIYDILILDIMLPILDGISVLKALRKSGNATPVLLLTAKGTTDDKVFGLDSGADDYLAKPFEQKELLARVRALARRKLGTADPDRVVCGNVEYNAAAMTLSSGTMKYLLTKKESQVWEVLAANRGHIVSKNTIIEKVWGFDSEAEDSHVEVYVSFLRKKLSSLSADCEIQTLRGAGYTLKIKE